MDLIKSIYLDLRTFLLLGLLIVLSVFSFFYPWMFGFARVGAFTLAGLVILDAIFLYIHRDGLRARRNTPEKFSNGDENEVMIAVENLYGFPTHALIIDEVPVQLQLRNVRYSLRLAAGEERTLVYAIRPVRRGEYRFGTLNVLAAGPLGLVRRRYRFNRDVMVPVYPSFLQLRRYELLAHSNRLTEVGIKRIRKVGHTMEFDQIREYVVGDDYRTINWKATARRNDLMVNQYQDEKSQRVYCIIDKGRPMKMPFDGMTLLDHSINASLILSSVALNKGDRAGLVTFSEQIGTMIPADRKSTQMQRIVEALYNQKTSFRESNVELLYTTLRRRTTTRSLMLFFTNFETLSSLERQIPFFRGIARNHLLVVVFFINTELKSLLDMETASTEDIYVKTIAEKFAYEKKLIVKELERFGIHSVLTTPQGLTVNAINKYLELKSRRLI